MNNLTTTSGHLRIRSTDQIWSHMNRAVNSRQQLVLIHIVKLLVAKSGPRAKCGRVDMQTGAYS